MLPLNIHSTIILAPLLQKRAQRCSSGSRYPVILISSVIFVWWDSRSQGSKGKHNEGESYKCNQCHFTSKWKISMNEHIKVKHGGVKYQCDQCEYSAGTQRNLNQHKKWKHDQGKAYQCDQCEYSTRYKHHVKQHQDIHNGMKYSCNMCPWKLAPKVGKFSYEGDRFSLISYSLVNTFYMIV